jgi:hypothetical protein
MGARSATGAHHRLAVVAEPRDIPDALREAVERTVQATVDTRGRAQGAVDDLTGSVDELVKGAEKSLSQRRRSVRAAVGERLPATQEDIKEVRADLRRIARRLDAIEQHLEEGAGPRRAQSGRSGKGSSARRSGGSSS